MELGCGSFAEVEWALLFLLREGIQTLTGIGIHT